MADEAQSETVESVGNNETATGKILGGVTGKGFMPGQSGNPKGRPQRKPLTDAYLQLLSQPIPGDKDGRTYAQAIAQAMIREAVKGKVNAASELADRIEGKSLQRVAVSDGDPLTELLAEFRKEHEALPDAE